ncbi:MAG: hypothetical protein CLLPBCKN_003410 [Chroococcidiopsis cubana SAG 39.79]|uniref:Uncharacterized protein n=1 Tax=Chroococcidiopsis thermalis (strain PCC 7203) TaxID=251229 RepID=K9TVZ7_CHRTP|nr:hypothetical protein Chro_1208 [Chroococcidiopsis thermalis PCC 7203]MDZ4874014.1 hypothetical protein [Chroococcidiopsis cubana SAG 39.79]
MEYRIKSSSVDLLIEIDPSLSFIVFKKQCK